MFNSNKGGGFTWIWVILIIAGGRFGYHYLQNEGYLDRLKGVAENRECDAPQSSISLRNVEMQHDERQREREKHAQPFTRKVIYNFDNDFGYKGKFALTAADLNAVFVIREKLSNQLMAVATVPSGEQLELLLPYGEYVVEYATGSGQWYGLDHFWGYRTEFFKSNTRHIISENQHTGIVMNAPQGIEPDRISQRRFEYQ